VVQLHLDPAEAVANAASTVASGKQLLGFVLWESVGHALMFAQTWSHGYDGSEGEVFGIDRDD
jgi:hypothetical protein